MLLKTITVRKSKDAKNGVTIDYSLPEKDDWEELETVTGIKGQQGAFEFIVAMYEKRLASSMRLKLFPTMKNITHPKTGKKYAVTALDKNDPAAVKAAVEAVKLIQPKAVKVISTADAFAKIEQDLKAAGVNAERIAEFRRQHEQMKDEAENQSVAND
jgi:hypothetical protein